MLPKNIEDQVYQLVTVGKLIIDAEGRVWRVTQKGMHRAEKFTGAYLQVRAMLNGIRHHSLAHRLVWRHFKGPIPSGLTVNHKNGVKTQNHPDNLELATYSEQIIHVRSILRKALQNGERNNNASLSDTQVMTIRERRSAGESLKRIAADFNVSDRTISKIALNQRRVLTG